MGGEHGLTGRAHDPSWWEEPWLWRRWLEADLGASQEAFQLIPHQSGSFQLIPAQESQRPESQAAWEALTSRPHHRSRETGPQPGLLGQVPWASLSTGP